MAVARAAVAAVARVAPVVTTSSTRTTVAPSTPGADVFERFQTEPNTLALAVVDDDGRPLGIIERNAFTLRMAAEFGRALYARKPAESLMDRNAPVAEAATKVPSPSTAIFCASGTVERSPRSSGTPLPIS